MQEFISLDVLLNLVQMLRANINGAIVLADDEEEARFYERLIHPSAQVIPAYNVAPALLVRLTEVGIEGVIATTKRPIHAELLDNLFCPTLGDVASLLLSSSCYQSVISDVCGTAWIQAAEKVIGPLLPRVVNLARLFNPLRILTEENGRSLDIQEFIKEIDWKDLTIKLDEMQPFSADAGLLAKAEDRVKSIAPLADNEGLMDCNGMDVIYILAAATQFFKPRGISAARKIQAVELLGLLRVGFQLEELENDDFFWRMKKWERQNIQYPLLSDWRTLDPLETVWDQRYWRRDLEHLLQMLPPGELLAVLKMDLDNFKAVNDELGHSAGDDALRHYCSVVKRVVGRYGYVYRRGGDEIVALVPEIDISTAQALAEESRAAIESSFRDWAAERGITKAPTASIGLVIYGGRSPLELIELMDAAQREAKASGKNRVVMAPK
jgi:diguanylate cyclase (GGDEF)-like protein